jgi:hypothetical protein
MVDAPTSSTCWTRSPKNSARCAARNLRKLMTDPRGFAPRTPLHARSRRSLAT